MEQNWSEENEKIMAEMIEKLHIRKKKSERDLSRSIRGDNILLIVAGGLALIISSEGTAGFSLRMDQIISGIGGVLIAFLLLIGRTLAYSSIRLEAKTTHTACINLINKIALQLYLPKIDRQDANCFIRDAIWSAERMEVPAPFMDVVVRAGADNTPF